MTGTRPASPEDILQLAPRLREADRNEILAATGEQPAVALLKSFALSSEVRTIIGNDEIAGMYGIGEGGLIWLMASDALPSVRKPFMREARETLDIWRRRYGLLWNVVDSRNQLHITWLSRMGASFTGRQITLLDPQVPFLEFYFSPCV